jgi:hypothetical protein
MNMSYCAFQNTLEDLRQCQEILEEGDELSEDELRAARKLVEICRSIANEDWPSLGEDD